MFVAEKAYAYSDPGFAETKLTTLAKQLRARNPNMTLVFYYNANLCLTDYSLYTTAVQPHPADKRGWLLKNSSGDVYIAKIDSGSGARPPFPYTVNGVGGVPIYNFTVPEMRAAWVQECFDMTSYVL